MGLLQLHDLARGQLSWKKKLLDEVICLALDPNGTRLAVCSYTGPIVILDVATGKPEQTLPLDRRCWAIAFSRDGRSLVVGLGQPVRWDLETRKIIKTYSGLGSVHCSALDFSPDGRLLVAPYRDGQVCVWEVHTAVEPCSLPFDIRPKSGSSPSTFSPDGSSLAVTPRPSVVSIETDRFALASRFAACSELKEHRHTDHGDRWLSAAPDGRWLASRSLRGEVVLVDLNKNRSQCLRVHRSGHGPDLRGKHGKDPGLLSRFGEVDLVGRRGQQGLERLANRHGQGAIAGRSAVAGHAAEVLAVAPGDQLPLVAVLTEKTWSNSATAPSCRAAKYWQLEQQPGKGCVAAACGDGRIRLWDRTGNQTALFSGHRGAATAIAFSKDGRLLASGGVDLAVCLWDTRRPAKPLHVVHGHGGCLTGVAFTPDGRRLASCSNDGRIKIWDTRTGSELLSLTGHDGQVSAVAFSPDGGMLASCGYDGVVRLWDGRPLHPLTEDQP